MRLSSILTFLAALAAPLTPALGAPPDAPAAPPNPDDLLGNIVVEAGAGRVLPKIAVVSSLSSATEDVTVASVVRRDLELCGEFELLADAAAPGGAWLSDGPVDTKAWSAKGVEAVVRVSGKPRDGAHAELRGEVFFPSRGATAVFDQRYAAPAAGLRGASHRLADKLFGALTGTNGGFASRLTFAMGTGGVRRVFTLSADGHDLQAISSPDLWAVAPAFGKNGELYYGAAPRDGIYQVRSATTGAVVPIPYQGSVYGIAFSRDHASVAVALGARDTVQVYAGPDFASLRPASEVKLALHPAFSPSGKLAFSGEGRFGQRIFVDGRAVTPEGLFASSPVFCNHPGGVRLVFAAGVGRDSDLVATGERGGSLARLTRGQGRNTYPACSPDGRLLAFFSTRTSGEGPGLYLMRLEGGRPKRIAPLLGDSLRWDVLPGGDLVELRE